jgi:hypothetical protein
MAAKVHAGTKTQTRRICMPAFDGERWADSVHPDGSGTGWIAWFGGHPTSAEETVRLYPGAEGFPCPYGVPGDQLRGREAWRPAFDRDLWDCIEYRGDGQRIKPEGLSESEGHWFDDICPDGEGAPPSKWRASIHMPRWACRSVLDLLDVRVQRAQEISEEDARAEGVETVLDPPGAYRNYILGDGTWEFSARSSFGTLWDSINSKRGFGWTANPWVWALTFKKVSV